MTPPLVQAAADIAAEAHANQFRNDGMTPYIEHPKKVMMIAEGLMEDRWNPHEKELTKIICLWHDILEDVPSWSAQRLINELDRKVRISNEDALHITHMIHLLNKNNHPNYLAMILAIKQNPIARVVKIADIKHNMSDSPSKSNMKVYQLALYILEN